MTDGIGLTEHEIPVVSPIAAAFSAIAGAADRHRQQRTE
jgi:hypothetical protein